MRGHAANGRSVGCRFMPVCLGILYHISMDDAHKSLFVYTKPPALDLLFERLVAAPDVRREPELIALAVNLTQNVRCAAALVEGSKFDRLMRRAIELRDDLLFKVMRNVSQARPLDFPAAVHCHSPSVPC
jgi:hypothetical protein